MDGIFVFLSKYGTIGLITAAILYLINSVITSPWASKLFDTLLRFYRNKKKNRFMHNLNYIFDVYKTIDEIYDNSDVSSVSICKGSNGGGIPAPGRDFYVKTVNEIHKENVNIHLEKQIGIKVDTHQIETLIKLATNNKLTFIVAEMPDCLLKRMWVSEGMMYKELYFLHATSTEYYFCSIGSCTTIGFSTESQLQIELAINSLRQIFEKFNK